MRHLLALEPKIFGLLISYLLPQDLLSFYINSSSITIEAIAESIINLGGLSGVNYFQGIDL
jgi:hypothetical protein